MFQKPKHSFNLYLAVVKKISYVAITGLITLFIWSGANAASVLIDDFSVADMSPDESRKVGRYTDFGLIVKGSTRDDIEEGDILIDIGGNKITSTAGLKEILSGSTLDTGDAVFLKLVTGEQGKVSAKNVTRQIVLKGAVNFTHMYTHKLRGYRWDKPFKLSSSGDYYVLLHGESTYNLFSLSSDGFHLVCSLPTVEKSFDYGKIQPYNRTYAVINSSSNFFVFDSRKNRCSSIKSGSEIWGDIQHLHFGTFTGPMLRFLHKSDELLVAQNGLMDMSGSFVTKGSFSDRYKQGFHDLANATGGGPIAYRNAKGLFHLSYDSRSKIIKLEDENGKIIKIDTPETLLAGTKDDFADYVFADIDSNGTIDILRYSNFRDAGTKETYAIAEVYDTGLKYWNYAIDMKINPTANGNYPLWDKDSFWRDIPAALTLFYNYYHWLDPKETTGNK